MEKRILVSGGAGCLGSDLCARLLKEGSEVLCVDPGIHPQPESYWGHVNPPGIRSCYDEGKRCAQTLFFDYYRQHALKIKVAREIRPSFRCSSWPRKYCASRTPWTPKVTLRDGLVRTDKVFS
jgi:hypothetical protein